MASAEGCERESHQSRDRRAHTERGYMTEFDVAIAKPRDVIPLMRFHVNEGIAHCGVGQCRDCMQLNSILVTSNYRSATQIICRYATLTVNDKLAEKPESERACSTPTHSIRGKRPNAGLLTCWQEYMQGG